MGKNKRERRKRNWKAAAAGLILLAAGSGAAYGATGAPALSKQTVTLVVGDTVGLRLKNKPAKAELQWTSDKKGRARVSGEGLVTAVKKGTAVIACRWRQGNRTKTAACRVKVVNPQLGAAALTVEEKGTGKLDFRYRPKRGRCTWTSADEGIASVNASGVVRGKKAGSTSIRCVVRTGGRSFTLRASVRVVKKKPKPTPSPKPTPGPTGRPEATERPDGGSDTGGGQGPGGGGEPAATKKPGGSGEAEEGRGKTVYEYDALHRLTRVRYGDGSSVEYRYDANGNLVRIIRHKKQSRGA